MTKVKDINKLKVDFENLTRLVQQRVKNRKIKGSYEEGYSIQEVMSILQKNKVIVPANTMQYFRTHLTLRSYTLSLYPTVQGKVFADYMKLIILENLFIELPDYLKNGGVTSMLKSFLNIYEKDLLKTILK